MFGGSKKNESEDLIKIVWTRLCTSEEITWFSLLDTWTPSAVFCSSMATDSFFTVADEALAQLLVSWRSKFQGVKEIEKRSRKHWVSIYLESVVEWPTCWQVIDVWLVHVRWSVRRIVTSSSRLLQIQDSERRLSHPSLQTFHSRSVFRCSLANENCLQRKTDRWELQEGLRTFGSFLERFKKKIRSSDFSESVHIPTDQTLSASLTDPHPPRTWHDLLSMSSFRLPFERFVLPKCWDRRRWRSYFFHSRSIDQLEFIEERFLFDTKGNTIAPRHQWWIELKYAREWDAWASCSIDNFHLSEKRIPSPIWLIQSNRLFVKRIDARTIDRIFLSIDPTVWRDSIRNDLILFLPVGRFNSLEWIGVSTNSNHFFPVRSLNVFNLSRTRFTHGRHFFEVFSILCSLILTIFSSHSNAAVRRVTKWRSKESSSLPSAKSCRLMEIKDHSLHWISFVKSRLTFFLQKEGKKKSRKDEHEFVGTSLWESLQAFGSWFN